MGVTTFDEHLIDATAGVAARLRRIVGDPAVAEDLCQETFVRAWRVAPRDVPPERLRAWLYRTATNLAVDELRRRARREGFERLCAFTHAPGYFIHMGFSIVPHLWLSEKVFTDCVKCPQFRQCGQYAMVVPLDATFDAERGYGLPAAAPLS